MTFNTNIQREANLWAQTEHWIACTAIVGRTKYIIFRRKQRIWVRVTPRGQHLVHTSHLCRIYYSIVKLLLLHNLNRLSKCGMLRGKRLQRGLKEGFMHIPEAEAWWRGSKQINNGISFRLCEVCEAVHTSLSAWRKIWQANKNSKYQLCTADT